MAEQAATTAIREAIAARLRDISVANGYRTDVGSDVRTEPSEFARTDASRVTIYPGGRRLPDDFKNWGERSLRVIVEIQVSVQAATPMAELEAAEADVEQALEEYVLPAQALPMHFIEGLVLERPDGVPSMCAQLEFATRYRR